MDKQVSTNHIEQMITLIDQQLIPLASESNKSEELGRAILLLKGKAILLRQQIRKA